MQRLIVFWKKDLTNKLIVMTCLSLFAGGLAFLYLIGTMPAGKSLAGAFSEYLPLIASPTPDIQAVFSSLTATAQAQVTSTPQPLPTSTPVAPTASATATASLPTPTETAQLPAATLEATFPPVGLTATPETSLSTACVPDQPRQTGTALDVLDGNTVKVLIDGSVYVVRYIGVSVQDSSTPFGRAAAVKNGELVFGRKIILVSDGADKDASGHLLRYLMVGDTFINRELIAQGLASALDTPPGFVCAQALKEAQQSAVSAGLGQWSVAATLPSP